MPTDEVLRIAVPCLVGTTQLRTAHPRGLYRLHPGMWNVLLITDGPVQYDGAASRTLQPDDLVVFHPDARMCIAPPRDRRDPAGWRWFAVADQPRLHNLLRLPPIDTGVGLVHLGDDLVRGAVHGCMDDLQACYRGAAPPRRTDLLFNHVERLLLWADAVNPRAHAPHENEQVAAAVLHLRLHFDEPLSVADLAAASGWTPSHFAHRFRAATGLSPMRYLEEVRIRNACDLLRETDWDIGTIALRCGFADPAYFSRVFRKHWRTPPGRWRRMQA
ncbi:MAG: helix-turn-helix domain-containing protein [Planctomycetota bacterium]